MASQPIISASVPEEVLLELDEIARLRGETRSVVIRKLLEYALNRYQQHQSQYRRVQV
jgi:metal-responsive CopG/Arc/MetJ family transcriptional regulator